MSAQDVVQAHQSLLDTAERLVDELDEVPAGAVLRCFSRAVRQLRHDGCSVDRLPVEADRLTRHALAERYAVRVPLPRGA